ncbi:MAG: general secretion pathway protein J [Parasphingorhabdus sp.]|jgi:general secretion pathway protein J
MAAIKSADGSLAGRNSGFTLLEMVIAIAIFSIIGMISFVTLDQFIRARETLAVKNAELKNLQQTFLAFDRDIRFMVSRPVRDELGETIPALQPYSDGVTVEGDLLEFTASAPHPSNQLLQRLYRVSWSIKDQVLVRNLWLILDRDFDSVPRERKLLSDVASVEVNYLKPRETEPGVEYTSVWEVENGLPVGVELIVTLTNERTYRRLLEVGG